MTHLIDCVVTCLAILAKDDSRYQVSPPWLFLLTLVETDPVKSVAGPDRSGGLELQLSHNLANGHFWGMLVIGMTH